MKPRSYIFIYIVFISVLISLAGCNPEEPQKEDVPELITKATLTFTPTTGTPVSVSATDPDGEGVQNIETDGPITLAKSATYVLTISLINGLAQPSDAAYDVDAEVEEEGAEHQFFFLPTAGAFTSANVYTGAANSKDENGLPLGLTTTWVTTANTTSGEFRVVLKHQPGLKSSTSTIDDGETDLDITFQLSVQ